MIRKIRRNITEAAVGQRLNRYGTKRTPSFKSKRVQVITYIAGLFKSGEYLKHRTNRIEE